MSKQVVQLITRWSEYEEKHANPDIVSFCRQVVATETTKEKKTSDRVEKIGKLARIIGRLSSVYGLYHRAAMLHSGLPANDSFFFLNVLNQLGEVKKSDLINYLLVETTTGMEAINKLVTAGLVKERRDQKDKRAKLIKVSDKGIQKLKDCMPRAKKVNEMVFKDLSDENVSICIQVLEDIEKMQTQRSIDIKQLPFDEMYSALMKNP